MFDFVVMPLTEFWNDGEQPWEERLEALDSVQKVLAENGGGPVSWTEEPVDEPDFDADSVEPLCVYALRAVAAWLEVHGSLEGFELDDAPWEHAVFATLEERDGSQRFPQLLHSEADVVAFVPAELPDVYFLAFGEGDEPEDGEFAAGSLPRLAAELDDVGVALDMTADIDDLPDDFLFDSDEDPLAAAKYAWAIIRARVKHGLAQQRPLVMFYDEPAEEDEEEEGAPAVEA